MIYSFPPATDPLDQGDLIDGCPLIELASIPAEGQNPTINLEFRRVVVLTQTCDLANDKATSVTVAEIYDTQFVVDQGYFKPAEIKGLLRSGRIWGWYFLPAAPDLGLGEMIANFRRLHTVKFDVLRSLVLNGKRRARVQTPYREHLSKHFADSFSRIGLPQPYETL